MIAYKEVMVKHFEIEFINCDKCGKVITPDNTFEYQEIYRIHFWGGYGSVFGDGTEVDLSFCQHCLKELVGQYVKE